MGQAVPEIPLSVGSKLELLRTFVFANFPYTSPYTHAFVRLSCIYYIQCMTEAPRVLHFSAFIIIACTMTRHGSVCATPKNIVLESNESLKAFKMYYAIGTSMPSLHRESTDSLSLCLSLYTCIYMYH